MAYADPCLAPGGGETGTTSVCAARIDTTWPGAPAVPPAPAPLAIAVTRTRAAPAGADSTTVAVRPAPPVFPATTACWLIGAADVVKLPRPLPGTRTAATTGTFDVSSSAAAVPPSGERAWLVADCPGRSIVWPVNGRYCPWGVIASTLTLASPLPGTARNSSADLLDGGTPGITCRVEGDAALGSQLDSAPCEGPSSTSAATRPTVVRTCIATTVEPAATDERASVTIWCGGTMIPVSSPARTRPASVMTLTFTVADRASTFMRSSWICPAPSCWPGPANQRSEPGALQRTLARPELCATSASMAEAIAPVAVTDQPTCTGVAFLPAVEAAGTDTRERTPGPAWLIGATVRSWAPAGGSGVSSACPASPALPALPAAVAAAAAPISAIRPDPVPRAGAQARVAVVTATGRPEVTGLRPGTAGRDHCAAPPTAPSATSTAAAGTRWSTLMTGYP